MAKSETAKSYPSFLFVIIGVLLIVVFVLIYKLYSLTLRQAGDTSGNLRNSIVLAATLPLPLDDLTYTSQRTIFSHPELGYTVTLPDGWIGREYRSLAGTAIEPYEDVILLSPDYTETNPSDTDATIEEGASIFIRGTDTPYKTIEERFQDNVVAHKVATNVTRRTINGIPVIQYEYELAGENVTNVTMIKKGIWYLIKFQYADSETKVRYARVFEQVVQSFRPK